MSPVTTTYWGIPGYVIFWVLFVIAFGLFAQRLYLLVRLVRLGKHENRFNRLGFRIISMLSLIFSQWCSLKNVSRKDRAGIGHALMFWGFGLFVVYYFIFIGLGEGFGLFPIFIGGAFDRVSHSIMDIVALIVVLAVIGAIIKRYIAKPERLVRDESTKEKIILASLFSVMISVMLLYYSLEGFRYAAHEISVSGPLIGSALANFLASTGLAMETLISTYKALWWVNYILLLVVLVYTVYSEHLHPYFSPANLLFRSLGTDKVVLEPIPLEALEDPDGQQSLGVSNIQDFKWKQLLDLVACTWCGRCHVNCPAQLSGKSLSPREVILNVKEHLLKAGPELLASNTKASENNGGTALIGDVVTEDEIWACTTCGACQEVCPSSIEHIRTLIDLRRNLVMAQNKIPESAQIMLRNLQSRGHPWSGAQSLRLRGDWINDQKLKVLSQGDSTDTLLWVGCTGALVERNVKATLAMARVLQAADVDFAVLGEAESCCGDPARRAGYEFQFQIMAEDNIEVLKSHDIQKIITTCPHCFHTLKNEYPSYGGEFKIVHYSQFVSDLVKQGKLKLAKEYNTRLTYHDPCYLGRYNGVYKEPREMLQAIPMVTLEEMERSRSSGLCCGGGGGHMWIEEEPGTTKINHARLEDVLKTGSETVVTACPYCLQMLEEGIENKEMQDSLQVKDLIEIIEAATKQS